jgi:hypothetical protein
VRHPTLTNDRRQNPKGPQRLASFAAFFKSYMHVSGVLLACVPIPVASLKLLPIFSQQKGYLTVYSSLFCFLLVAALFSLRHSLAKSMFNEGGWRWIIAALPFVFIVLSLACILGYHATLQDSLQKMRMMGAQGSTADLLQSADSSDISKSLSLSAYYLGIFVFAECAFTLLALREYLQDAMGLDEVKLLAAQVAPNVSRHEGDVIDGPADLLHNVQRELDPRG